MNKITWLVIGLALAGVARAGQQIDETRDLAPDGLVTVINVAGDIDISTWDRPQVHLTGQLGDKSKLDIQASSGGLRIEVKPEDKSWNRHHFEESDLTLKVPAGASLSVNGVSSDINISGSRGESITVESVSGDIEVDAKVQSLDLSTVSGDVDFRGSSPRTSAEAVSGDLDLEGLSGELEVSLVSGDADVRGGEFSRGKFESVSGELQMDLSVEAGGRLTVESMSGDVVLHLPADQQGEIRAQTFSGDIRSQFGSPQREKNGPGSKLQYEAGSSGATIHLESFSGDIQIGHK